ncbi:MAG: hypothetical protein KatS3mg027_2047 [Bacteroidia bacterium]|nr:MAG: hypothetical protein KatS3mg027_2047 [Bacteroidia bacterium]
MKDLPKRSVTALFFAAVLLCLIYYSFYSFLLLLLIISTGGILELKQLFKGANFSFDKSYLYLKYFVSVLLILYPVFDNLMDGQRMYFYVLNFLGISLFIEFLFKKEFSKALSEFFMLLYILIFLMSSLNVFYFSFQKNYIFYFPLSIVLMIWANDTFAYFTGMLFGKHKLMPEVSPKKSVEGFVGGVVFSIVVAVLMFQFFLSDYNYWTIVDVVVISMIVGIFGTIGDLIESKVKRLANVKDSGNLLPGHGGILDRFDAWYIAIPVIDIFLHFKQWLN